MEQFALKVYKRKHAKLTLLEELEGKEVQTQQLEVKKVTFLQL